MEIGRISGPLLKSDLLRQGVNLAFENDLLYLKVSEANKANHRIGIKTSNPDPTTALDINGTAKSKKLVVTDSADIGNLNLELNTIKVSQLGLILKSSSVLDIVDINNTVFVDQPGSPNDVKVKITGDVKITGNLHATGAITADGNLTLGDANTDNIVFKADIDSNFLPNITDTYNLGSLDKRWLSTFQQKLYVGDILIENDTLSNVKLNGDIILTANGLGIIKLTSYTKVESDLEVLGKITLGTDDSGESILDTVTDTVNIVNNNATTVNFAGAATKIQIGAVLQGTTTIRNDLDVDGDVDVDGNVNIDGDLEIKGEDLTTDKSTFNLLNTTATTVNFAGAGTTVNIGATRQGTTNVKNDLDVDGVLEIKSGDLTTNQTTFNLANTTATTVNFAGAATNIEIGSSTGTTNVNNDLDVDGDVKIDGGDLRVSTSVFNLANDTATTVNFAGDATNVQIGSDEGDTNVNNNLTVDGVTNVQKELTVEGDTKVNSELTVEGDTKVNSELTVEGDTTVNSRLTVEGIVDVNNSLYVTGNTDLSESLNVQGSTSVQRELVVEGNTQMNKSLAVEGELKAGKLVDTIIDCGEY
jgi:cytoskeletal protein CcmA (bactofilin family)